MNKAYDRARLIIALILVSPLILIALLTIFIGYPLHLLKNSLKKAS